MKHRIETLLSQEFYCSLQELHTKGTIYSIQSQIEKPYIKILAYRDCVVVCTSRPLHEKVRTLLQGKNRDEIFELPLVYGQTIHYIPNSTKQKEIPASSDFTYGTLFGTDLLSFAGITGFDNSLTFNKNGTTSTKAICFARDHNNIIGIAGAAESSVAGVWELGVDVREEYRKAKLGTYLVRTLTNELLARDILPFYSASVTNIGSQMVASRCGYIPCWVDTYGTVLDGSSVYHSILQPDIF